MHVFGHTHFGWDHTLDGIRYIQAPVSYPNEWKQRPGRLWDVHFLSSCTVLFLARHKRRFLLPEVVYAYTRGLIHTCYTYTRGLICTCYTLAAVRGSLKQCHGGGGGSGGGF